MDKTKRRSQRDYTLAFKLAVVDQVEKGEMTYNQAQTRFGIQGSSTVLQWLRRHGRLSWQYGTPHLRRALMPADKTTLTPEQRIKELEQQLRIEKQKADFFEAVVTVMKRDHGATLLKKSLRKSAKKSAKRD